LTAATGATVKNVEVANLTAAAAVTKADVSGWTGLQTLNVTSTGSIAGVTAAATTDVNVANGLDGVTVNGGKNVTISNSTAGHIFVGKVTAAAGNVTATNTVATGTVDVKGAGTLTATAKDGAITFTNGTSVVANTVDAVAAATRAANLAAQTAATSANTAAATDADASGLAKLAAVGKVSALTTLANAITNATGVSAAQTGNSIQAATQAAVTAGAITAADKLAIDAAFIAALPTTLDAAKTAAQALVTPLQTAATAASTAAIAADVANDAKALAAKNAADAVVAADVAKAELVNDVVVTATTNTALASATIKGNYGSINNAVTDASTLQNTLTTVTLENAGNITVTGLAVANVSATGQSSDVTVVNATANHAINYTLSGVTGGTYTDVNATTVNIVSNGNAANVLTGLSSKLATKVNLSGTAGLTFGTTDLDAAAVIDASANSGNNTISIGAGQKYIGGSGNDVVTAGAALQTATVDGGAGNADRLVLTNTAAFATTGAAKFLNFEVLETTVAADVSKFTGSTIGSVIVSGVTAVTGLSATQAANVTIKGASTPTIGVTGATNVGQLDTVKLTISDGLAAVNTIALTTPVLAGVETLNITATDNFTINGLTSAAALTKVTVSGAGTTSITTGALPLNVNTVIDASAATGAVTIDASDATANGLQIIGSATKANVLTGNALASILTGGAGNDKITGGAGADVISGGEGNNTIEGGGGADVITAGNGNNQVTLSGATGGTVTLGNGYNTVTGSSGADTIVVGTGGNSITGGAGADVITFGAHVAGVMDGIVMGIAGETWTGALITSGATALTGVDKVTGLKAGDTIDLAALSPTFTGAAGTTIAAASTTTVSLVKGSFDATTNIWTTSATGTDTLVVYDADAAVGGLGLEAIVLVGTVATGTVANGVLTLA
jgi:S-layer protein